MDRVVGLCGGLVVCFLDAGLLVLDHGLCALEGDHGRVR